MEDKWKARFRAMMKGLGWSWEDVEAVTGHAPGSARKNFTKGVPMYGHLAVAVWEKLRPNREDVLPLGMLWNLDYFEPAEQAWMRGVLQRHCAPEVVAEWDQIIHEHDQADDSPEEFARFKRLFEGILLRHWPNQ